MSLVVTKKYAMKTTPSPHTMPEISRALPVAKLIRMKLSVPSAMPLIRLLVSTVTNRVRTIGTVFSSVDAGEPLHHQHADQDQRRCGRLRGDDHEDRPDEQG